MMYGMLLCVWMECFDLFDRWIYMVLFKCVLVVYGVMLFFVLLWSSGVIFVEFGLCYVFVFVFFIVCFVFVLFVLFVLVFMCKCWLLLCGEWCMVVLIGLLMMGGYLIFYLFVFECGIVFGVFVMIFGVQLIFMFVIVECCW